MQNCENCFGKRWYAKLNRKTGLQIKNSEGKLLWRCYRCGHVQTEPTHSNLPVIHRTDASILYIDLEISKSRYFSYGHKVPTKYLRADDLDREYYIICWSASYVGEDKIYHERVSPMAARNWDDSNILKRLQGLMASADILAGHNIDAYDLKRANTRFLQNGFEPVSKRTYDTLKIARSKFAFDGGNGLENISRKLGFRDKDDITNDDWLKIVKTGDKKTLEKVDAYCQGDVTQGKRVLASLVKYSGKKKDYGSVTSKQIEDMS